MSAVLAVCSTAFCAMMSDGRMVEEPAAESPRVLTEQLPKLRKLNPRVCVGFAGDTLAAVQVMNVLDEFNVQYLTLEKTVRVLQEKARTVEYPPLGVRFLVGGRDRHGSFTLASFGSGGPGEPFAAQFQPARDNAYLIEGACSHTEIAPFLEQFVKAQASDWKTMDDVGVSMQNCISAIAKQDKTVNTEFYRQLIL